MSQRPHFWQGQSLKIQVASLLISYSMGLPRLPFLLPLACFPRPEVTAIGFWWRNSGWNLKTLRNNGSLVKDGVEQGNRILISARNKGVHFCQSCLSTANMPSAVIEKARAGCFVLLSWPLTQTILGFWQQCSFLWTGPVFWDGGFSVWLWVRGFSHHPPGCWPSGQKMFGWVIITYNRPDHSFCFLAEGREQCFVFLAQLGVKTHRPPHKWGLPI